VISHDFSWDFPVSQAKMAQDLHIEVASVKRQIQGFVSSIFGTPKSNG
jgi:hypothetical protein